MQTRCPYSDCQQIFLHPGTRSGPCLSCNRPMSYRPMEMLAEVDKRLQKLSAEGLLTDLRTIQPFSAILEDVRSLWNVGSIFRSADGAGCKQLYLCGITGNPPRKEIAKVSLGAEETVGWQYDGSALPTITKLKAEGVFILSLEFSDGKHGLPQSIDLTEAIAKLNFKAPLCMVVGNEVTGVSHEILSTSDAICHLPMRGMKESLNVAVAFGIAAYYLADHFEHAN